MVTKKHSSLSFEAAVAELEGLVVQLEQGDLSLEETLQRFEQGISLVRSCQTTLRLAEQKVEQLLECNQDLEILPIDETAP